VTEPEAALCATVIARHPRSVGYGVRSM
jgi:hypothetical protein